MKQDAHIRETQAVLSNEGYSREEQQTVGDILAVVQQITLLAAADDERQAYKLVRGVALLLARATTFAESPVD